MTACALHILLIDERADRADKIELGDELVKILQDSFIEMCQEGSMCKNCSQQLKATVAEW